MSNKKLLARAEELGLEPVENESDEALANRINEAQNNQPQAGPEFDPTEKTTDELLRQGKCPDCKGLGIRNPDVDNRVCQTCEGSGKA